MKEYKDVNAIIKDIKNKMINEGDTIVLCEGKERVGMSTYSFINEIYLKNAGAELTK